MSDYKKQVGDTPAPPNAAPEKPKEGVPHPSVGINADRGCTDICGILLLIVGIILIALLANISFKIGDPMRLLLGTDYLGNVCGQDPAPANLTVGDWPARQLLWYPLTYDFKSKKLLVTEALDLGICVSTCPGPG